jgi:non-homologous end joining protein Ku
MRTSEVPHIPFSDRDYNEEAIEKHITEIRHFVASKSITNTEFDEAYVLSLSPGQSDNQRVLREEVYQLALVIDKALKNGVPLNRIANRKPL